MTDLTEEDLQEAAEARVAADAEGAAEPRVDLARVEDVDAGGVPARLYLPRDAQDVVLYLHGGGFVTGGLVAHDGFARRLASRTGRGVLLPAYRLAPEHPWPAADEDAAAAADWLADQGFRRLDVVGDSAGSALAIGEVLRHPLRYVGQVQVYPFVDPSCASYDDGIGGVDQLTVDRCRLYWRLYLQGADASGDPALQVLDRGGLSRQPPALVQLAELDVLTPTGHRYAERLRAHGVPVRVQVYPGVQHGFWRRSDNDQAARALDDLAEFLDGLPTR